MDLEIKKDETTLEINKDINDLITIDMNFQDTMDLRTITMELTKDDVEKVIKQLQSYIE